MLAKILPTIMRGSEERRKNAFIMTPGKKVPPCASELIFFRLRLLNGSKVQLGMRIANKSSVHEMLSCLTALLELCQIRFLFDSQFGSFTIFGFLPTDWFRILGKEPICESKNESIFSSKFLILENQNSQFPILGNRHSSMLYLHCLGPA